MKINELTEKINATRKGTFVKVRFKSDKGNGFTKETKAVVRLGITYSHMKGVQPNPNPKANPNIKVLIPHTLTQNTNTGNTLLHCATTTIKPKCRFFLNGAEISKEEFEQGTNAKPSKPTKVFTLNADNVISLGNE